MEKHSLRHVDTMSGSGHLLFASATYQVSYKIDVYQEYIEVQGVNLEGLKEMKGYLEMFGDKRPDLSNPEEAILELEDGRKIGINLPPLLGHKRVFEFTLRDQMDLKE